MVRYSLNIDNSELHELPANLQIEVMRGWFFERFEDPAERTPYESREGGYQWVYGGPYDAREQIEENFSDVVDQEAMDQLIDELDEVGLWAPTASREDYDDFALDDSLESRDCLQEFKNGLESVSTLLAQEIVLEHVGKFRALLYANVITVLETYLFDTFAKEVLYDRYTLKAFLESYGKFSDEKIKKSQILVEAEQIETTIKKTISDIVWHNLPRVEPMYLNTLGVKFPDIGELQKAALKRHDFAHRNGRDKDGNDVLVADGEIDALISIVETFVNNVDTQLKARGAAQPSAIPIQIRDVEF